MPLDFIASTKGKQKLLLGGFTFIKDRRVNTVTYWKCDQCFNIKCRARVHTANDSVVKTLNSHNHAAHAARIDADRIVNNVKETAISTQDSGHLIVSSAVAGVQPAVAGQLPTVSTLKRTIRRSRQKATRALPNPTSLHDLQIPMEFTHMAGGERFLQFDSGPGNDRILLFCTQKGLQLLQSSDNWFADGTFKTSPSLFVQLYTVHGIQSNKTIPAVFALLPDKRQNTYSRLFEQIKCLIPQVHPKSVLTDFESAAMTAISLAFPSASIRGCFFHFAQCIYRQIQTSGLQVQYESDAEFALQMRYLSALAFVPTADVVTAFEDLTQRCQYPDDAQPVVDYFEDTWIGRPIRGSRRRQPLFAHEVWNCYNSVNDNIPKTNNSVEGWHRSFNEMVSCNHPTIWKFINALKLEQSRNDLMIEQFIAGRVAPPPKKKYRDCAQRIIQVVSSYNQQNLLDYLRGIAHNYNF
jgi:hypothetical protein